MRSAWRHVILIAAIGACTAPRGEPQPEPEAAPRAAVLTSADSATQAAVDFGSRVHLAPRAEQSRRSARVRPVATEGATSEPVSGAEPPPSAPPRSASEAAERPAPPRVPPPLPPPTGPDPVAPTAPAETRDPFRR